MNDSRPFNPSDYGSTFAPLIDVDRRRPLDGGSPDENIRATLASLSIDGAFDGANVVDADMAACCLSAVWLLHDFLDESHAISQRIKTPTGSFWHGIMHRREGDFSNAKYWFRNAGDHPASEEILATAVVLAAQEKSRAAQEIASWSAWDPFAFVDLCEHADAETEPLLRAIQQIEWERLLGFCYRSAVS